MPTRILYVRALTFCVDCLVFSRSPSPALRVYMCVSDDKVRCAFEAAISARACNDGRLELVVVKHNQLSTPRSCGFSVSTVVHEIDRRFKQVIKAASETTGVEAAVGGRGVLPGMLKAQSGPTNVVARVGLPCVLSVPRACLLAEEGVSTLIAVRPPNMSMDKPEPLEVSAAQDALTQAYRAVLEAWATTWLDGVYE
jgi:hypothetical protein